MTFRDHVDLVILAADKDIEQTIRGVLHQPYRFPLRPITYDVIVHSQHDPGVLRRASDPLRPLISRADYALAVFDRDGCGDGARREDLEEQVEGRLTGNGWENRCAAIAIDPELENWVGICLASPTTQQIVGWPKRGKDLKDHFREKGSLHAGVRKLDKPKETFHEALRLAKVPRSAALYFELAKRSPIMNCVDPAFSKLRRALETWFPQA